MRMKNLFVAFGIAMAVLGFTAVTTGVDAEEAQAMNANPSQQDTARLLGYMWGDGTQSGNVWDVNAPSGTAFLVEELVARHGGTFVNRSRLTFTLPAPYNWSEWTSGLPDDSSAVRAAVQDPNFLAAVLETEASVVGQIYDQSACCVNGYTIGRLTELRDLMRDQGYSTTSLDRFNDPNSGRITVAERQWDDLRRDLEFACTARNSDIRIPGGTNLGTYGNIRYLGAGSSWSDAIRTDCTTGRAVATAQPAVGSCTSEIVNNRLVVDWTYTLGSVVIRVDGSFAETVSGRDGSWDRSSNGRTQAVTLRVSAFGAIADVTCTSGGNAGGGGGAAATCTVTASGNQVNVDWDNFGASSYAVRSNGSWVTTTGATQATVPGSTGDSWIVRYRQNGRVIDVPCASTGGGGGAASPCSITRQGGGVVVDWAGVGGVDDYQVRRNGNWIATASGQSRYDDSSGSLGDSYEIRYRLNGRRSTISCG